MKKKPLFVAFATQKGGVGKTAVTVLVAGYLHYVKGYNVAVIDCDYPQHSISGMREREIKLAQQDETFKTLARTHFTKLQKKAYPVVETNATNSIADAQKLIAENQTTYDIVFFDLPGTIKSEGVVKTLSQMDYIFTPLSADRVVAESTIQFATMLNEYFISTGKSSIKGLYLFWTMVDAREKTELYEIYEKVVSHLGLNLLATTLPDSKRFRRELVVDRRTIVRSTFFPIGNRFLKSSRIEELTTEICRIIELK